MKKTKLNSAIGIRKYVLFSILIFSTLAVYSQSDNVSTKWNLQTCIDYALANNIQIKTVQVDKKSAEVDKKLAQAAMFPSVSASVSQGLSVYPFSNSNSSTSSSTNVSGGYNVNASWKVFDGGIRSTNIKQTDLQDTIAQLTIDQNKNDIKLSIIQNYLQILYANENVSIYESAVVLSAAQVESNKIKLEIGAVAKSDLAQWESQNATDKYDLVNAKITLANYKLQLKQLLELNTPDTMNIDLATPTDEDILALLPDENTVFETAMDIMPQVKSGQLNTKYTDLAISKAKAGYLPDVSLSAGIGTSNIYNNTSYTFPTQLKNNYYNSIGLSVNIPVYSNREIKSAVEKAELSKETAQLNEQSIRKELFSTIETAYRNAVNSQEQYRAAQEKVKSSQASYDVLDEQFKLGLKNTIELLTGKNTLISSEQELIQAKYNALMYKKILEYYQGLI